MAKWQIAIVTPWLDETVSGDSDTLAWHVAHGLSERGHTVRVLTTDVSPLEEGTWPSNERPEKRPPDGDVIVERFPLDQRDATAFTHASAVLNALPVSNLRPGIPPADEATRLAFKRENVNSMALQRFLAAHQNRFDATIFLACLYGTTLQATGLGNTGAFLQPLLRDATLRHTVLNAQRARRQVLGRTSLSGQRDIIAATLATTKYHTAI